MSANLPSALSVQLPMFWSSAQLILTTFTSLVLQLHLLNSERPLGASWIPSLETIHTGTVIPLSTHLPSLKHHCLSWSDAQCLGTLVLKLFHVGEKIQSLWFSLSQKWKYCCTGSFAFFSAHSVTAAERKICNTGKDHQPCRNIFLSLVPLVLPLTSVWPRALYLKHLFCTSPNLCSFYPCFLNSAPPLSFYTLPSGYLYPLFWKKKKKQHPLFNVTLYCMFLIHLFIFTLCYYFYWDCHCFCQWSGHKVAWLLSSLPTPTFSHKPHYFSAQVCTTRGLSGRHYHIMSETLVYILIFTGPILYTLFCTWLSSFSYTPWRIS